MIVGLVVLIGIVLIIVWSLGRAMDITDAAWKSRKIKGPCPYCGSMTHRKSWHTPGAQR